MPQKSRAQRLNGLFPLSYTGVVPVSPVNFVMDDRPPTVNDSKNFYIGDLWLDTTTVPPKVDNLWMLVDLSGNIATWVNFGAGDLETLTGNSGGPVFPDGADNINVIGDGTTINVVGNPGTNTLTISAVGGLPLVETLTGNSGGAVGPDGANNINVVGTGVITVVGNPGTNTLTVTPSGAIADSFPTDSGTAIPVAGVLNVLGSAGISTSGAGNTITIASSGAPSPMVGFGANKSVDTPNATGDGTFFQVICDNVIYDLSSNYDGTTGTFTAPTDGTYHFDTYIAAHNITTQNLGSIFLVTTARTFETDLQSPVNDKQADNILHYQMSVDTLMSAGDTAYLQISLSGAAKTVGITGSIPPGSPIATYFNGHRLDPAASFITGAETFHTDDGNDVTPDINGLVNVTGVDGVFTSGTVGPNTITIHYVPTSSFTAAFPVAANVTGDGTIALLGATVAATVFSNVGGNFNPGNGAGVAASYTAPATGLYYLSFFANYSVTASPTAGVDFSLGLTGALGLNFGILPTSNACPGFANNSGNINTGGSSLALLTVGDVVNFSVQSNGTAKNVTVGGTVSGYRIS